MSVFSLELLRKAYTRVRPFVLKSPIVSPGYLKENYGADFFIKSEQFQEIGAFKIRGAANFALQLDQQLRTKGFVTHSSGNHAQAVARMANALATEAHIVMPSNSNKRKVKNAEKWGAKIYACEPNDRSRKEEAQKLVDRYNATLIPPFDHEWIVLGQATCAMEMVADIQDLDYLLVPLGGGGLLSGSALAMSYLSPQTKVIGVEPKQASDGFEGFKQGKRIDSFPVNTIADGLRTMVGEIPFEIIKDKVHDIWLAEEHEIVFHMYQYWSETKHIIEPSCAVTMAALDAHKAEIANKRVGIIITGGNVDFSSFPQQ